MGFEHQTIGSGTRKTKTSTSCCDNDYRNESRKIDTSKGNVKRPDKHLDSVRACPLYVCLLKIMFVALTHRVSLSLEYVNIHFYAQICSDGP